MHPKNSILTPYIQKIGMVGKYLEFLDVRYEMMLQTQKLYFFRAKILRYCLLYEINCPANIYQLTFVHVTIFLF